jgi:hypothetical protein
MTSNDKAEVITGNELPTPAKQKYHHVLLGLKCQQVKSLTCQRSYRSDSEQNNGGADELELEL